MSNKKRGLPFILSAPAGTGKTTLAHMLVKEFPNVKLSISYTTRAPRKGERDGVDYHFVLDDEFSKMEKRGDFLESAKVFDYSYGTSRKALEKELAKGFHVLLVIDTQGAAQVRLKLPVTSIFIAPPSTKELEKRLKGRKTDKPDVIEKRLAKAKEEMAQMRYYDYRIINAKLEDAYEVLRSILIAEEHRIINIQNCGQKL